MATLLSTEDKPRRSRRRGGDRWRSEVKGILALAVAGFGLVALATFDPARPPTAQHSPMGPVGVWLAWAAVKSFGYGGFLFPLLLGAWGASAFVRPLVTRGWAPLAGLALLLVSATGLLTQASHTLSRGAAERQATVGGLVGWAVSTTLRAGVGSIGAWLVLIAALAIGVLVLTRMSYAALARVTTVRLARLRGARMPAPAAAPAKLALEPANAGGAEAGPEVVAPPVVVEPRYPRGRLAEQGLAWQARGAPGERRDDPPEAPGLRGRGAHRPGEPRAGHHVVRVRARAGHQGEPGRQPRG